MNNPNNAYRDGSSEPLAGLLTPQGELTDGQRPKRTLRLRNAIVANSFKLEGKSVLELGCAEGLHSLYMSEAAKEVVGIDHRTSVIESANANKEALAKENVTFLRGDVRDPEIYSKLPRFDLVVAWGFIHRLSDVFSFAENISSLGDTISLEWRTPVFPFMSHLSMAYHPKQGEALDPTNLGDPEEYEYKGKKVEGQTGFWEPTPEAVKTIFRRKGFVKSTIIGYGDHLHSQRKTIIKSWSKHLARAALRKPVSHSLPLRRVHMILQRDGTESVLDKLTSPSNLPRWDKKLHDSIQKGSR